MKLKQLTLCAVLIAFTVVMGTVVSIPIGREVFTLANTSVFVSAFLLGKKEGLVIGALSGLLIDGLLGFWLWAPVTLLVYGTMGFVAGLMGVHTKSFTSRLMAMILCWAILVGGYLLGGTIILGSFAAALAGIGLNIAQGAIGGAIAMSVYPILKPVLVTRLKNI